MSRCGGCAATLPYLVTYRCSRCAPMCVMYLCMQTHLYGATHTPHAWQKTFRKLASIPDLSRLARVPYLPCLDTLKYTDPLTSYANSLSISPYFQGRRQAIPESIGRRWNITQEKSELSSGQRGRRVGGGT